MAAFRSGPRPSDIVLVQADNRTDHFPGVRDELAARGLTSSRQDEPFATPNIRPGTKLVVTTLTAPRCMLALRQASKVGARTALLLDGITDWRNTLANPRQTESYLRPAGVDLVLCSGLSDARVLRALGNRAAATGLPRIDAAFRAGQFPERGRAAPVLVATANTPAFSDDERRRLLAALRELRDEAGYAGVPLVWRLTGGLDDELGVASDWRPLADVLAGVQATICTPSTLLIESMRAALPTAVLHASATPLWHAVPWVWQPSDEEPVPDSTGVPPAAGGLSRWVDSPSRLLRQLTKPTGEQRDRQLDCLRWLDASSGAARAAELVAEEMVRLVRGAPSRMALRLDGRRPNESDGVVVSITSAEGAEFERVADAQRDLDDRARASGQPVSSVVLAWDDDSECRARRARPEAEICRLDRGATWDVNASRILDSIDGAARLIVAHAADTPMFIAQHLGLGVPLVAVAHNSSDAFTGWRSSWPWVSAVVASDDAIEPARRHAGRRPVRSLSEAAGSWASVLEAASSQPVSDPRNTGRWTPSLERLPARAAARGDRRRVVSLLPFEESPLGGVTMFSVRLAESLAARPDLGYDAHTLFVAWDAASASRAHAMLGEHASLCVLDRSRPMHEVLDHLRESVELCDPDIVLPNYTDASYMVAAQLRHTGARCVAIGHTDDDSYRELLLHGEWDGAVAVSASVRSWLAPLAGDRPCETITYGVPIAQSPRQPQTSGPLQIAYLGRVVQPQKRVLDLVPVMRALDAMGVEAVLHVVGDGSALGALRRAFAETTLNGISVEFHGERDADWVRSFLPSIDVSILVSEAEGTSISMLEAMGVGVVPAVTAVSSGADEWVEPRASGVIAPIGDARAMATELAWLAEDRTRLRVIGAEAHRRVAATQSQEAMAERYAALFDRVLERRVDAGPDTAGVTPIEPLRWASCEASDPDTELKWTVRRLREAGYQRVASSAADTDADTGADSVSKWRRDPSCDVVVHHVRDARPTASSPGVPVVRIGERACRDELVPHVERLRADGFRRIAIYGLGRHTQWRSGVFDRDDLPIVGIIDDSPPPSGEAFGLPVVALDRAIDRLRPDAVLLSSDAWESPMFDRSAPLRSAGVHLRGIYTHRAQAAAEAAAGIDA